MDSDEEEEALLSGSGDHDGAPGRRAAPAASDAAVEPATSAQQLAPPRPGPCSARAGDGKATVWWGETARASAAGLDNEERPRIDTYIIIKYRQDGDEWRERGAENRLEVKYPTTSVTVEGLDNKRTYQFAVRARSRKGALSEESQRSLPVTPYEPLPEPWTEHFDAANGRKYYYNPETQQRTYNRPVETSYPVSQENSERFSSKEIKVMRLRFSEVDEDDSGFIDFQELMELFKELELRISDVRARKFFREIDADGSGKLEFDEFLTLMWRIRNPTFVEQVLQPREAFKSAAGVMLGKFKAIGEGDRVERAHQLAMLKRERMGDWEERFDEARRRKYYVNRATKERTWTIPDEVAFYVPPDLKEEFTVAQLEGMREEFERFDIDRSGEMDVDELTEAMRALGDSISHKQVLSLVKTVDVDGSGELNFAEFVKVVSLRRKKLTGLKLSPMPFLNALAGKSAAHDKAMKDVQLQLMDANKKNKYLVARVESLERENRGLRRKKFVFIPIIPRAEFLADYGLLEYDSAMAKFGIVDTTDLYRLEESDLTSELGLKLGHKRKLIATLRSLEERLTDGDGSGTN